MKLYLTQFALGLFRIHLSLHYANYAIYLGSTSLISLQ